MARLFLGATELELFWCLTIQSYQKLSTKALSILVLFAITCVCKSGFSPLLHLKNNHSHRLNPSNNLRVALSDCVPSNEQILLEKQQKQCH